MGDPERDERATVPARPASRDTPGREAARPAASAFDPGDHRFEARGELGRGGMGRVDDAFDTALGRPVAIKHMLSAEGVDLARFEREARITARLEHPGIVPIHDAGRGPDGTPYYVMRRVDGQPLAELVAGKSLVERLALIPNVLAACDAAAFAHARGVVHRDIKPNNILVGPFGETLLIDWGLARELGESDRGGAAIPASDPKLTRVGTVAGTPGFMAPEQARGETVDVRADVWALGATLFYVLAGQQPYGERSATEMVNMVGNDRPPDWNRLPDEVAPDLRAIVVKAMALDPRTRYGDAAALAADLRRFVTGNLVGAYDYGTFARLRRFVRKHRAAVAVALVSAGVLAIVAVLSVRRVVEERDAATAARALAEQRQRDATDAAELQLLQRARESLDRDPTATITLLRALRPDSKRWAQAATIAQGAALRGIPFGFTGSVGDHVEFSPDSSRLATISTMGSVHVCSLAARTCQLLVDAGARASMVFLDRSHIVVSVTDHMMLFDLDAGTQRSRSIPGPVSNLVVASDGAMLLWYPDRIDVLDGFDAIPRPFLPTSLVDADRPADIFCSQQHAGIEVWTRSGAHWVLDPTRHGANVVSRDTVISFGDDDIAAWRIAPTGPELLGKWKTEQPTFAVADRTGLYVSTMRGVVRASKRGVATLIPNVSAISTVAPDGKTVFLAADDGTIHVYNDTANWQIGRGSTRYQSIRVSPDGRYVAGVAINGTLLVWDVDALRPRIHLIDSDAALGTVNGNEMILTGTGQLYAQDLSSGERRTVLEHTPSMPGTAWRDPTGTMLGVELIEPGDSLQIELTVLDAKTFQVLGHIGGDKPTSYAGCADGLVLGLPDGTVELWSNRGQFERTVIAHVAPGPSFVVLDRDSLVAVYGKRIVRLDRRTNSSSSVTMPADVEELVLAPSGAFALAGGVAWHWNFSWPPAPVRVPGRVVHIYTTGTSVLLRTSTTVMAMTDPPSVITSDGDTMPSSASLHFDSDSPWIALSAGPTKIVLADLASGISFVMPVAGALDAVVLAKRRLFVQVVRGSVLEWDLRVPTEPGALRAWLESVTNAKGLPDSDAVLWP